MLVGNLSTIMCSSRVCPPGAARHYPHPSSVTLIHSVRLQMQEKIHVSVEIQGSPCTMEVDSESAFSFISAETFEMPLSQEPLSLEQIKLLISDFQGNHVPILGAGKFGVCYKEVDGLLDLLVADGRRTSIFSLAWFNPFNSGD